MKTQVIGLGNAVLCDDSAGIHILEGLRLKGVGSDVTLTIGGTGGIALIDMIIECDRLIIVDAIMTGAPPGTIHALSLEDLGPGLSFNLTSSHGPGLGEVLALREKVLDLPLPEEVHILAIEAQDVTSLSETCTPAVDEAIDNLVDQIFGMI